MFGADKIALGSDYPFPLGENHPGNLIRQSGYEKIIQEKLLSGAALNWMNMKKEQFL